MKPGNRIACDIPGFLTYIRDKNTTLNVLMAVSF